MLFILTGGPGSGKSAIIDELRTHGYRCAEESGRKIILEQIEKGGDALPWKDKEKFRDAMFEHDVAEYKKFANSNEVIFFDRGFIDSLGYSKLEGLEIPKEMDRIAHQLRYNSKVFITPPWHEIYHTDSERKQSFEVAVGTYESMVEIYSEYGYELIEIPKTDIQSRVQFMLEVINR